MTTMSGQGMPKASNAPRPTVQFRARLSGLARPIGMMGRVLDAPGCPKATASTTAALRPVPRTIAELHPFEPGAYLFEPGVGRFEHWAYLFEPGVGRFGPSVYPEEIGVGRFGPSVYPEEIGVGRFGPSVYPEEIGVYPRDPDARAGEVGV